MKVKILMYEGTFIDVNKLPNGLYTALVPFIFHESRTMEEMVEMYEEILPMYNDHEIKTRHIENLKKCTLETYEIKKIEQ